MTNDGGESELLLNDNRKEEFRITGCMKLIISFFIILLGGLGFYMFHIFSISSQCLNESPYLLVTSHSDRNVAKFDRVGCRIQEAVLWGGKPSQRGGLRSIVTGLYFNEPALYVAATDKLKKRKVHSSIEVFGGCNAITGFRYHLKNAYNAKFNKSGSHPYGMTFDDEGNLYASFQHTDNVLRFYKDNFQPMPVPKAVNDGIVDGTISKQVPLGTFIQFGEPGVHVSKEQGVRAIAWADHALWVANEDTNSVLILDAEGYTLKELFIHRPIGVQYIPELNQVLISSKNKHKGDGGIYAYDVDSKELVKNYFHDDLVHPTGLVYYDSLLYIAEQTSNSIFVVDVNTGLMVDNLSIGKLLHGNIEQVALSDC